MSPQIIKSSEGVYRYLRILSNIVTNISKLPEGALYKAIIHILFVFKYILQAQASKSLSLQNLVLVGEKEEDDLTVRYFSLLTLLCFGDS
jgi:hypothetical protein